ncbi:MAG TPA: prolyl oligopeptidase family serine peptidase [Thermoanaerobaculia bacterium]|nr:prolyl oligopeptidase family serine peptidase [Thermoanaerobaculia bacterium]
MNAPPAQSPGIRLCILSVCVASVLLVEARLALRADAATLEEIFALPFASQLTAAPAGGHVAWLSEESGIRNVWIASPPGYEARPLTAYETDDGEEIRQLVFSSDGRTLFFVRGSPSNPLSKPEPEEQAIWSVLIDDGSPSRIAEGNSPAASPAGDRLAFLRRGEPWIVPLDGGEAERLFRTRGRVSSLRWSPDGSRLAFVNERGEFAYGHSDYSFVGIFDLRERKITWIDPAVYRDHAPVWSPDGHRLAFVRMRPPLTRRTGYSPRRDLEPWSIRVADPKSGRGREIFRTSAGSGSVFQGVVAENPILWAAEDRIVFPWQKDGWLHLYSIAATGGTPVLLTPGEYEVEHVTLNPRRNVVIYSSNEGDPDRRHIWQVPVSGEERDLLTPGRGIETSPAITSDGEVLVFVGSNADSPSEPMMMRRNETPRPLRPANDQPRPVLAEPQPLQLTAEDGVSSYAQISQPKIARGRRAPAVIYLHGGPQGRQQLLGWPHGQIHYHHDYAFTQYLASRGYVVLTLNYRGGAGYGLEFRDPAERGVVGASEYRDVLAAARYLRGREDVDPGRIALWGASWGGYLTALGLARNSDLFAAGVIFYGPYDWVRMWSGHAIPETSDQELKERVRKLARESSPIASVDGWRSPVLIVHGGEDRSVDFEQAVVMAEDLRARGVEVETVVHPDEPHGFLVHRHVLEAYRAAGDFLDRRIGAHTASR